MSPTVREIIKIIDADGLIYHSTRGSHRQFVHPIKKGRVTVAGKPSEELGHGTHKSILQQAGLKEKK